MSGTEPVINQECMLVHQEKWTIRQFEWYRDNYLVITVSDIYLDIWDFFYASSDENAVLARAFEEHRDNLKNSQSGFQKL